MVSFLTVLVVVGVAVVVGVVPSATLQPRGHLLLHTFLRVVWCFLLFMAVCFGVFFKIFLAFFLKIMTLIVGEIFLCDLQGFLSLATLIVLRLFCLVNMSFFFRCICVTQLAVSILSQVLQCFGVFRCIFRAFGSVL